MITSVWLTFLFVLICVVVFVALFKSTNSFRFHCFWTLQVFFLYLHPPGLVEEPSSPFETPFLAFLETVNKLKQQQGSNKKQDKLKGRGNPPEHIDNFFALHVDGAVGKTIAQAALHNRPHTNGEVKHLLKPFSFAPLPGCRPGHVVSKNPLFLFSVNDIHRTRNSLPFLFFPGVYIPPTVACNWNFESPCRIR